MKVREIFINIIVFLQVTLASPLVWPYWFGSLMWPFLLGYSVLVSPVNLLEANIFFTAEITGIIFIIFGLGTIFDILRGELLFTLGLGIKQIVMGGILTLFNLNYLLIGLNRFDIIETELITLLASTLQIAPHYLYAAPAAMVLIIFVKL